MQGLSNKNGGNMKTIRKILVSISIIIFASFLSENIVFAAMKVDRAVIQEIQNIDLTSQKIIWEELNGVSGYEVFCREAGKEYRKIASVSKSRTSYIVTDLKVETKYIYKIRAFKKSKGKKYYGKYSVQAGKTTSNYLMDIYEPYHVENYNSQYYMCELYKSPDKFSMGGKEYSNGFTLDSGGCRIVFNVEGKYENISFWLGTTDTSDRTFVILADDEEIFSSTVSGLSLPKLFTVNIKDVSKLEFRDMSDLTSPEYYLGFADIKLLLN